jgi:hypothetical protein
LLSCWVYNQILGFPVPAGKWNFGPSHFTWIYSYERGIAAGGRGSYDSFTEFVGSYRATIIHKKSMGADWLVKVRVENTTGWTSGTRLPGFARRVLGRVSLFVDHPRGGARYSPSKGGTMTQAYEFFTTIPKCPKCTLP